MDSARVHRACELVHAARSHTLNYQDQQKQQGSTETEGQKLINIKHRYLIK